MDIDSVRWLVQNDEYSTTREFDRRLEERKVTMEQVKQVIATGRIVREEPGRAPLWPKCTIRGFVSTDAEGNLLPIAIELKVACAVGDEVRFITVYWID